MNIGLNYIQYLYYFNLLQHFGIFLIKENGLKYSFFPFSKYLKNETSHNIKILWDNYFISEAKLYEYRF